MNKMVEIGVKGWRSLSFALLLGTGAYGAFVAADLVAGDAHRSGHGAAHQGAEASDGLGFSSAARAEALPGGLKTGLGRGATEAEVAAWDIDIRPDGKGLPQGSGDVATGEQVFAELCASCHGDFAEGVDRWPVLAGGLGTLATEDPVKTVGSYWPYLSTVWDYVHRAMPFGNAQSLTDDEVYAITAYILYSNDLVDDDFVLSHENFAATRLPNEENFFMDDREKQPLFGPREVCMKNCKDEAKIVMRARVLDVTPEGGEEAEAEGGSAESAAEKAEVKAAAPAVAALNADLVAAGEKVFKKCKACHKVGDKARNGVGPKLNGIFGAQLAAVEGFKYSKALKAKADEGLVWDETTLAAFLEKPKAWAKGTRMAFAGLRKEKDRAAIVEYLKSVSQ